MKCAGRILTFSIVALSSLSCGGSATSGFAQDFHSDGGACASVPACGGSITPGTYTISAFCEHSDPTSEDGICQGATGSVSATNLTGTLAFSDMAGYTLEGTQTIYSLLFMPASCMTGTTCSDLAQRLAPSDTANTSPPSSTASCSGTGSCSCMKAENTIIDVSGHYSALDGALTFTNLTNSNDTSGISAAPLSYCVSGNQIAMSTTAPNGTGSAGMAMLLTRR